MIYSRERRLVFMVERNMSNAVMPGIVVPPVVEAHITRTSTHDGPEQRCSTSEA